MEVFEHKWVFGHEEEEEDEEAVVGVQLRRSSHGHGTETKPPRKVAEYGSESSDEAQGFGSIVYESCAEEAAEFGNSRTVYFDRYLGEVMEVENEFIRINSGEMKEHDQSLRAVKSHALVVEDEDDISSVVSQPKRVRERLPKKKKRYTDEVEAEILEALLVHGDGTQSNATRIELMNKDVRELAESPDCPNLTSLSLQMNSDLTAIPTSFFQLMPNLQELDLSNTSIKSLPQSLFKLVALRKLVLRSCQVVMELPAEIGQLHNLEVLDLQGTDIIKLPPEIGNLTKLTCLKVSFCQCIGDLGEAIIIPQGAISKLSQLQELYMDVDPEDSRWDGAVKVVVKELVHLKKLKSLKLYVPQVEVLGELTANLPSLLFSSTTRFNLNVGSHKRRVMSRTPLGAEHGQRHLRYVNGEGSIPSQVKNLLKYSDAFFLDRHFTVTKLSEFEMHNMEKLRSCVLGECNELQTIIQGSLDYYSYKSPVLPKLQQLVIYNMRKLTSLYSARLKDNSLGRLKTLKLHGCAQLRTIFTFESGIALIHLEEVTVEDCPAVVSLVTCSNNSKMGLHMKSSFQKLKRICLHYLPELESMFSGLCTAPCLERVSIYNCPNLKNLSAREISQVGFLKVIRGEKEWWGALEWNESEWTQDCIQKLVSVFVPIRSDADLETQLAEDLIVPPVVKKSYEDIEIDVEGVIGKQDTHDLFCPNCHSCITKRVILRRRERKLKMIEHEEEEEEEDDDDDEDEDDDEEEEIFEEEEEDVDVEGVIEKQETHDLFCPNCRSCITKRVILRRRKRKVKMIEHDAFWVDNIGPPPADVFRCCSCLHFFILLGLDCFSVFGGKHKTDQTVEDADTNSVQKGSGEVLRLTYM